MKTVRRLLQSKGFTIWSVAPTDSVYDAIALMAEKDVGAVVVVENGKLVGIISERDYAQKVVLKGKSSKDTPVSEIMTTKVLYVRPDQTVDDCMALMTERHLRHLPVVDGEELIGIVSIRDVVKDVISHREFLIEQLENYITGGPVVVHQR